MCCSGHEDVEMKILCDVVGLGASWWDGELMMRSAANFSRLEAFLSRRGRKKGKRGEAKYMQL